MPSLVMFEPYKPTNALNIVIPAKAGIQVGLGWQMDPRFRGDDANLQHL
jgi:hypothetical protein